MGITPILPVTSMAWVEWEREIAFQVESPGRCQLPKSEFSVVWPIEPTQRDFTLSAWRLCIEMTPTEPAYHTLLNAGSCGIYGRVCFCGSGWQGEAERRAGPAVAVSPNAAAL